MGRISPVFAAPRRTGRSRLRLVPRLGRGFRPRLSDDQARAICGIGETTERPVGTATGLGVSRVGGVRDPTIPLKLTVRGRRAMRASGSLIERTLMALDVRGRSFAWCPLATNRMKQDVRPRRDGGQHLRHATLPTQSLHVDRSLDEEGLIPLVSYLPQGPTRLSKESLMTSSAHSNV